MDLEINTIVDQQLVQVNEETFIKKIMSLYNISLTE